MYNASPDASSERCLQGVETRHSCGVVQHCGSDVIVLLILMPYRSDGILTGLYNGLNDGNTSS